MRLGYSLIVTKNHPLDLADKQGDAIELNLQGSLNDMLDRRASLVNVVQSHGVQVLSVHAPNSIRPGMGDWERELGKTLSIADALASAYVVVHPPNVDDADRSAMQERVMAGIETLQTRYQAKVALETFAGAYRLFKPEELSDYILDTSHLSSERSLSLIARGGMAGVHLSARTEHEQHLPIDPFCLDVFDYLQASGFAGNVILEYRDQAKARADTAMLRERAASAPIQAGGFDALQRKGIAAYQTGDYSAAQRFLTQAIDLHPFSPATHLLLSAASQRLGERSTPPGS